MNPNKPASPPAASGKTALFESIAGLKPTESGQILINGKDVTRLSLEQRKIGIAHQDYLVHAGHTVLLNAGRSRGPELW